MSAAAWRNIAIVLAFACVVLWWRGRRGPVPAPPSAAAERAAGGAAERDRGEHGARRDHRGAEPDDAEDTGEDVTVGGGGFSISVPDWAMWFAPQPGENLLDYRDRVLPFAQAAVAPHRDRVQRGLADFAQVAELDSAQRAELDAAVDEAAGAIQDRVMQGLLSGELLPGQIKPSGGVAFARDVLQAVDGADQRFQASLRDDQRAALADHPFDVADYLVFSTRWEDMLGVVEAP